jgi:hypothetical protein
MFLASSGVQQLLGDVTLSSQSRNTHILLDYTQTLVNATALGHS